MEGERETCYSTYSCIHWFGCFFFFFFLRFYYLSIFRERGMEGEKHQCVVASHVSPTGDLACNPGICPDWESNPRPFHSQASAQSTGAILAGADWLLLVCALPRDLTHNLGVLR